MTILAVSFNIAASAQVAINWAIGFASVVFGFAGLVWILSRFLRSLYS